MTPNVLVELGFDGIIREAAAQTSTGSELLNRYQSYLMTESVSCRVVNSFVREASQLTFDSGVASVFEHIADYINQNKTSWSIASVCESINANESKYNLLNRNAATQAEKLLEMDEENVVKYIRAGALKNIMFCEQFRNIAKSVFAGQQIVESTADYTKFTPCSLVENVGDGNCFVVAGSLYKVDEAGNVQEAQWNEVSNNFRTVESLLESNLVEVSEESLTVKYGNREYVISEAGKLKMGDQEMTTEQFRDHTRMVLTATNPRKVNEVAGVMEAIALTAEAYDKIANLDNVAIYTTNRDKFVVIESGANLFAKSLGSRINQPWAINEDAIKACTFIKSKTNVEISENYKNVIDKAIEEASEANKAEMQATLENNEILSLKERIALLTEKFKNDPTKLAVLSKLAAEISE